MTFSLYNLTIIKIVLYSYNEKIAFKDQFLFCLIHSGQSQTYDIVLRNGRVIDPENGLDAIRNVGISPIGLWRISSNALQGKANTGCYRIGRSSPVL